MRARRTALKTTRFMNLSVKGARHMRTAEEIARVVPVV
jgi:hypothetical protein